MPKPARAVPLTDKFIASITSEQRAEYSDTRQVGLRVRFGATGRVTFAFRGRHAGGTIKTISIGTYPETSLKSAREEASKIRAAFQRGEAPELVTNALRAKHRRKDITLDEVVEEYAERTAPLRKIWQPSPKGRSDARRRIDNVFGKLLCKPVTELRLEDYVEAMRTHVPRQSHTKDKASGQVSRARAYLSPVLDWASGRKPFHKIGAGRTERLDLPDLNDTHDPAADDPTITKVRTVLLDERELSAVLPLLVFPAPDCLRMSTPLDQDLRPIAMRFLLLTAARLGEMVQMRWRDVSFVSDIWHKPQVKATRGAARGQSLPLSRAAIELLKSLPGYGRAAPDDLVFPNSRGGTLGNWQRINAAIARESGTSGWHRHDLRRSAATLMEVLEVAPSTIEAILGHRRPEMSENVSASYRHYAQAGARILKNRPNVQKVALDTLADELAKLEAMTPQDFE